MSMTALPHSKTVLFDLDGTIVDNFQAIYLAYRHAAESLGLEPATFAKVKATVGGSIQVTMGHLLGAEHTEAGIKHFRENFPQVMYEGLEALPGALELIAALHERGYQTAVFTNKAGPAARDICQHLGFTPYLDRVFGTIDTPYRKPQPEYTAHVLAELDAKATTTVMVGDSPFDLAAARTHGLACHLVATGSHTRAQLEAEDPPAEGIWDDLFALGVDGFRLPLDPAVAALS